MAWVAARGCCSEPNNRGPLSGQEPAHLCGELRRHRTISAHILVTNQPISVKMRQRTIRALTLLKDQTI